MGFHTFDADGAAGLEEDSRFRYCSREELLGNLQVGPESTVLDLGSGTGFFTDEVAPFVGSVVAIDLQPEMQTFYHEKGVPNNVDQVLANAEAEPIADGSVDAAFATMVFHEAATERSLAELYRVLAPDGRFVAVDWSAAGRGEAGPPRSDRFDVDEASQLLSAAGFTVETARERGETFLVVARR
jgi:ubiquinone/menaquinone biosynthesis C-methylase UbiE